MIIAYHCFFDCMSVVYKCNTYVQRITIGRKWNELSTRICIRKDRIDRRISKVCQSDKSIKIIIWFQFFTRLFLFLLCFFFDSYPSFLQLLFIGKLVVTCRIYMHKTLCLLKRVARCSAIIINGNEVLCKSLRFNLHPRS